MLIGAKHHVAITKKIILFICFKILVKIGNLFLCTATSNFTFYVFGHSNVRNLSYYVAKAKCLLHLQINVRLSHGIQQKFSLVYRNGMYKATIIGPRQTCSLTASLWVPKPLNCKLSSTKAQ